MTTSIIGKLKSLDAEGLATLAENARRVLETGTEAKKAEASAVLAAIADEQNRREQVEAERQQAAKETVRDKVKDLGLFDRVAMAFEKLPPNDGTVAVLKATFRLGKRFATRRVSR
jgi:hypothetical protein